MPDPGRRFAAMRRLDLSPPQAPAQSFASAGLQESYILPVIGRTELDMQASGAQSITVEDSMSMVHASGRPVAPGVAAAAFRAGDRRRHGGRDAGSQQGRLERADYDRIRDLIERTIPGFDGYNERIRVPGGFRMPLPPTERRWPTPSGKAMFSVFPGARENYEPWADDVLRLITIRSHDQYNTTIYGLDDRYRGVFGRRTCCSCIPPTWPSAAWSMAT